MYASIDELVRILQALQSPDNETRRQAEAAFDAAKAENASVVAQHLTQLLRTGDVAVLRIFAAVLLRRILDPLAKLWQGVDPRCKAAVRSDLVAAFQSEPQPVVRRKIAHCIGTLATVKDEPWPEVLPLATAAAQNGDRAVREAGLFLLARLAEYAPQLLTPSAGSLLPVLLAAAADSTALDTALAGLQAACALLAALKAEKGSPLDASVPPLLTSISMFLNAREELHARDAMSAFVDVTKRSPGLVRPHATTVVPAMLSVAAAQALDSATRAMAVEVVLGAAEGSPGAFRRSPALTQAVVERCVALVAEVEDDPEWAAQSYDEEEDVDQQDATVVGADGLLRFADYVGAKSVLPPTFALVPGLARSARWQERYAAASAVAMVADSSAKLMSTELAKVVELVMPLLQDAHQRVRFAGVDVLSTMAASFSGALQSKHHAQVVPALGTLASDGAANCRRVRGHATSALVNFASPAHCRKSALKPHLEPLLTALLSVLQSGQADLQRVALNAVANVARVVEDAFSPYYDRFMPGVKSILRGATAVELRDLRGSAFECVGLIAESVGKERFAPDARETMEILLSTQAALRADDPQAKVILPTCARIAATLGKEFAPYLPYVMAPVLAALSAEPEGRIESVEEEEVQEDREDEAAAGYSSMVIMVEGVGQRRVTLHTSLIEDMIAAANVLRELAVAVQAPFAPFALDAATILAKRLSFRMYEGLRSAAALALGTVVQVAVDCDKAAGAQDELPLTTQTLGAALAPLLNALAGETHPEARACIAEALSDALAAVARSGGEDDMGRAREPLLTLPEDAARQIAGIIVTCVVESLQRREAVIEAARQAAEHDDADEEAVQDAMDLEDELMTQLVDAHGYLLKTLREAYLPIFKASVAPLFARLMTGPVPPTLRFNAICVFIDAVEFCGPDAREFAAPLLPVQLEHLMSDHLPLRQPCAYGLGQLAEHAPDALRPRAAEVARQLVAVIQAPGAREEDALASFTENAVSTLMKLAQHLPDAVDARALTAVWLQQLPLRVDEAEARINHALLVKLARAQSPQLLGCAPDALAQVVRVLAELLTLRAEDEEMATPHTWGAVPELLRAIKEAAPAAVLQQAWGMLEPDAQAAVQRLFAAA